MKDYRFWEVSGRGDQQIWSLKGEILPLPSQPPAVWEALVGEFKELVGVERVEHLDLSGAGLGGMTEAWAETLAEALPDTLRSLDLSNNGFGEGTIAVCLELCLSHELEALYLGGNNLGCGDRDELRALVTFIGVNCSCLRVLELSGNAMAESVSRESLLDNMTFILRQGKKLEFLGFANNGVLPPSWFEGMSACASSRVRGVMPAVELTYGPTDVRPRCLRPSRPGIPKPVEVTPSEQSSAPGLVRGV